VSKGELPLKLSYRSNLILLRRQPSLSWQITLPYVYAMAMYFIPGNSNGGLQQSAKGTYLYEGRLVGGPEASLIPDAKLQQKKLHTRAAPPARVLNGCPWIASGPGALDYAQRADHETRLIRALSRAELMQTLTT